MQFVKTPTTCISPETTGTTIGTTTGTTTRVTKTTISSTDSVVAPRLSSSLSSASISRGGVRGEEMKRNEPEKRGGKTLNNKTVSNLKDVYDFPDVSHSFIQYMYTVPCIKVTPRYKVTR